MCVWGGGAACMCVWGVVCVCVCVCVCENAPFSQSFLRNYWILKFDTSIAYGLLEWRRPGVYVAKWSPDQCLAFMSLVFK